MAEGGGLLNRYTLQRRIEGSNPSVSAKALPIALRIGSRISLGCFCRDINQRGSAVVPFRR